MRQIKCWKLNIRNGVRFNVSPRLSLWLKWLINTEQNYLIKPTRNLSNEEYDAKNIKYVLFTFIESRSNRKYKVIGKCILDCLKIRTR